MTRHAIRFGLLLLGLAAAGFASAGSESLAPPCEPGFKYVQVVEYRECEQVCCKRVPDMRKKWVYYEKDDHFCRPQCRLFGGCKQEGNCDDPGATSCGDCTLHCRGQLFKKQVECQYGTKCVVEKVKTVVPCTVWKKVPCGPGETAPSQATFIPAPLPSGNVSPTVQ